jgi:hypothetical protein
MKKRLCLLAYAATSVLAFLLVLAPISCSSGGSSSAGSGDSAGQRTGGSNAGASVSDAKSAGGEAGRPAGGAASGGSSGGGAGQSASSLGGTTSSGGTTSVGTSGRSTGGASGGTPGSGGTSLTIDGGTGTAYLVAPTGSDSNPGTMAEPFKTITRARDVVRTVNASMTDDITVYLRGGTYNLTETLKFDPTDSGSGHKISYRAYPGKTPVIVSATQVKGWTQHKGDIYKASLARIVKLRSLYVNDKRATMASKNINCQGSWGSYAVTAGGPFTTTRTVTRTWRRRLSMPQEALRP